MGTLQLPPQGCSTPSQVFHTTMLPIRMSLQPALQGPSREGCFPQGSVPAVMRPEGTLLPKCTAGEALPHLPTVALTLAAQRQAGQLPMGQLMAEIHDPDGDIHLQKQLQASPHNSHGIGPNHTQLCKAADNLFPSENNFFCFPFQGWAETPPL